MSRRDRQPRSSLADTAGRVAFFPARAAARSWRGPLEEAADEVLSAPGDRPRPRPGLCGVAAGRDRVLARPPPRRRAHRRGARRQRGAGASRHVGARDGADARADGQGAREPETQRVLRHVASSPELRHAIARQTTEPLRRGDRGRARLGRQARRTGPSRIVGRPARSGRVRRGPESRRARLRSRRMQPLTIVLFMSVVGVAALVDVVGGRTSPSVARGRPARSRGWLLARRHVLRPLLERGGSDTGDAAAGACALPAPEVEPCRSGGLVVRLVGLLLAIVPFFAGFLPVLFTVASTRACRTSWQAPSWLYDDRS